MKIKIVAIRKAYKRLNVKSNPLVTFIVVQKRHHSRLFLDDERDGSENVLIGTAIDNTIVHPNRKQFYLMSHLSTKVLNLLLLLKCIFLNCFVLITGN
jgi:eukaryotic translation initiation factor 2C